MTKIMNNDKSTMLSGSIMVDELGAKDKEQ